MRFERFLSCIINIIPFSLVRINPNIYVYFILAIMLFINILDTFYS